MRHVRAGEQAYALLEEKYAFKSNLAAKPLHVLDIFTQFDCPVSSLTHWSRRYSDSHWIWRVVSSDFDQYCQFVNSCHSVPCSVEKLNMCGHSSRFIPEVISHSGTLMWKTLLLKENGDWSMLLAQDGTNAVVSFNSLLKRQKHLRTSGNFQKTDHCTVNVLSSLV